MQELLNRAMAGVDPTAPDAFWQIFMNLMGLVPWAALLWYTLFTVVVGLVIAWYRRSSYWLAIVWALTLGPIGWVISWTWVAPTRQCPRCGQDVVAQRKRCTHCGCALD